MGEIKKQCILYELPSLNNIEIHNILLNYNSNINLIDSTNIAIKSNYNIEIKTEY